MPLGGRYWTLGKIENHQARPLENDADWRVAEAAPDLLEALRTMPCIVCETAPWLPPKSIPGIPECPGCKHARAAIAKAVPK